MAVNQSASESSGPLVWPRSTAQLRDRQLCPACFASLHGVVCMACHLDLRSKRADDLLFASTAAANLLEQRATLIGEMRAESLALSRQGMEAAAVALPLVAPPTLVQVVPTAPHEPSTSGGHGLIAAPAHTPQRPQTAAAASGATHTAPQAATPAAHVPPSAPTPRVSAAAPTAKTTGRSSVQLLLLSIGVALVAIALVFFLIVAWFVADTAVRALIVAAMTALVFGVVSVLARFKLHSTAQGVAAIATLLVYLDLWGIQATNLLGAADISGLTFWGISLIVTSPALLLWFRFTGMRAASIAAIAALPLGVGLLVGSWAESARPLDSTLIAWTILITVFAGGLIHGYLPSLARLVPRPAGLGAERVIVLVQSALAGSAALLLALFVAPDQQLAPLWSLGAAALLSSAHAAQCHRIDRTRPQVLAASFIAAGAFALAMIPIACVVRIGGWSDITWWPVLLSVTFMIACEALRAVSQNRAHRLYLLAAAAASGTAVLLPVTTAFASALTAYFDRLIGLSGESLWNAGSVPEIAPSSATAQATVFLVGAVALVCAIWASFGLVRRRALILASLCIGVALAATALIPSAAIAVSVYLSCAVGATVALLSAPVRRHILARRGAGVLAIVVIAAGALAAIPLSFASPWLWLATNVVILALMLAAREIHAHSTFFAEPTHAHGSTAIATPASTRRTLLLCTAVIWTIGVTAVAPLAFSTAGVVPWPSSADTQGLLVLASGALLALFSLPLPRFATTCERSWALAIAAAAFVISIVIDGSRTLSIFTNPAALSASGTSLAVVASIALIVAPWNRSMRVATRSALIAITPLFWAAGAWLFTALAIAGTPVNPILPNIWAACVALVALAISLASALRNPTAPGDPVIRPSERLLADASAGIVLAIGLIAFATSVSAAPPWLVWIIAAGAVLLTAIDDKGLFNTRSLRHQWGWLALALGTTALWLGLGDAGIVAPEPYTIPLASVLLLVAVLIGRSGSRLANAGSNLGIAGASIVGVALLIGLVPSALAGANGSLLRPIIVIAISGVVLITAALWQAPLSQTPTRMALLASGGAAVALAVGARAAATLSGSGSSISPFFELWVLIGVGTFFAAALIIGHESRRVSSVFVGIALSGGALFEIAAIASAASNSDAGSIRAITTVFALSTAFAALHWRPRNSASPWIAPLSLSLAVATAVTYLAAGSLLFRAMVPFEWVTVPIAAALIAGGALSTIRTPTSGNRYMFTAGLILALLPSAFVGGEGAALRPVLVTAVAGVLAIGAAVWQSLNRFEQLRSYVVVCASAAVAIATGLRAAHALNGSESAELLTFDIWLLTGVGILSAVAVTIARHSARLCTIFTTVVIAGGAIFEIFAIGGGIGGAENTSIRAVSTVVVLSATYAGIQWFRPATLAPWLAPVTLAFAGVTALSYLATGAAASREVLPFEWVTIPVATAWILGGAAQLFRTPNTRSWPALGGGLALLLVPSLLADYVDSPLWRIVGLGVLAIAVLLSGLRFKLQAPFVVGSAVLLLHALAQLWPWIAAAYNPTLWWLWFGIGGVLLIVLAARYEKNIQNTKNAVAAISALR